ncbi:MAG: GDSL-type esterase/lipase family protein, partial [Promethearchaeota archaeon]
LTAGFPGFSPAIDGISQGYGNERSQYEYWLKKNCLLYLKKINLDCKGLHSNPFQFINKGIPGELTSDLLQRISQDLVQRNPIPSHSIIIGGTNDLGWGINIKKIHDNIAKLHEISNEHGISSIGATIPPIRAEKASKSYKQKKILFNNLLKSYFKENSIACVDLYSGMSDEHGNLRKEYAYIDGLHFSVEGYKKMGELIFEKAIKNIINVDIMKI